MTIKTCFFDMGNVLVHFSHNRMCQNIAQVCDWPEATVKKFLIEEGRQWKLERGEITEEQFCDEFSFATGRPIDITALRHAAADIFWLNESIVPVLQQLREAGMRLVLLSNTSITHLRFIETNFDVLDFMHDRITSFEVGALKPDEAIFAAALRKAQCEPEECFYTDDIQAYIDKARTFGIHASTYTTTDLLKESLAQLGVSV